MQITLNDSLYTSYHSSAGGAHIYSSASSSFVYTDTDDLVIKSYQKVSGSLSVSHSGNTWTFSNSSSLNTTYNEGQSRSASANGVVLITFGAP